MPISPALVAVSRMEAANTATNGANIDCRVAEGRLAAIPATGSLAHPLTGSPSIWGVIADRATIEIPANRTRTTIIIRM